MAVRTVAIKGVRSSRYLCMDEAGRLRGQVSCVHPGVRVHGGRWWCGGVLLPGSAFPREFSSPGTVGETKGLVDYLGGLSLRLVRG